MEREVNYYLVWYICVNMFKVILLQRDLIENQVTKSEKYSRDGEGLLIKSRPNGNASSKS